MRLFAGNFPISHPLKSDEKKFLVLLISFSVSIGVSCSTGGSLDEEFEHNNSKSENTSKRLNATMDDDSLFQPHNMSYSLYAANGKKHQSAASYGDYAIFVPDRRSSLCLYNLKSRKIVCEKELGAIDELIGKHVLYHCNQTTFGVDYYKHDDPFPLLYISQRAREDGKCFVEVYRLLPSRSNASSEYDMLDAELVQTICFPAMTERNALGRVNCVIDAQCGDMYTYSYSTVVGDQKYGQCRISRFAIPNFTKKEVCLNDDAILDTYALDYNAINSQGGCIKDGKLFIGQGYKSAGYVYLNVIDLKLRRLINRIDLLEQGITWEPEGCFFNNSNLMISTGKNIWEFLFQNQTTDINIPTK